MDVGKTLDKNFPSSDEEEEDKEVSDHKSRSGGSDDLSESSLGSEFASVDGYNSSGNAYVDEASSEIDEDTVLSAPLDDYDSLGNSCVDVDLTLPAVVNNTETDTVMEDSIIPPEKISTLPGKNYEEVTCL